MRASRGEQDTQPAGVTHAGRADLRPECADRGGARPRQVGDMVRAGSLRRSAHRALRRQIVKPLRDPCRISPIAADGRHRPEPATATTDVPQQHRPAPQTGAPRRSWRRCRGGLPVRARFVRRYDLTPAASTVSRPWTASTVRAGTKPPTCRRLCGLHRQRSVEAADLTMRSRMTARCRDARMPAAPIPF